ncbi:MAG: GFA family protein [Proteobacteria bacterium]|nr:GFA family protein [Pseudomonadota bacterium]
MKLEGGCYCGGLRYRAEGKPVLRAQCHCRACQHISGGAPNMFMLMPPDGFSYTAGTPKTFTRKDLDNPVTREFCAECGTHVATRRPGLPMVILKAGTLDDPAAYGMPQMAIFTAEMQPFHCIPEGLPRFEGLPPTR